jgi:hypothetical protein
VPIGLLCHGSLFLHREELKSAILNHPLWKPNPDSAAPIFNIYIGDFLAAGKKTKMLFVSAECSRQEEVSNLFKALYDGTQKAYLMFYLLKNMKFNRITGLGKSSSSYDSTQDGQTGQGVLQGSSSAAPIYILNSGVSLRTYQELRKGCAFKDPISGNLIHDKAVQFVDDTSQFLNPLGADIPDTLDSSALGIFLQQIASTNSKIWSDSMWISGGKLNSSKCYHYAFLPKLNFHKNKIVYSEIPMPSPVLLHNPENKTVQPISQVNPSEARRTLGVVLNPIGDGRPQLCHSLKILRELNGKLRSSQMSSQAKLLAVEMVIYPAVMYPMVNTYFSEPEFRPITSIISPL